MSGCENTTGGFMSASAFAGEIAALLEYMGGEFDKAQCIFDRSALLIGNCNMNDPSASEDLAEHKLILAAAIATARLKVAQLDLALARVQANVARAGETQ